MIVSISLKSESWTHDEVKEDGTISIKLEKAGIAGAKEYNIFFLFQQGNASLNKRD